MFMVIMLAMPVAVMAQQTTKTPCSVRTADGSYTKAPELGACVSQIYVWALGAAGILALLMMVFGGYKVMTAAGNAKASTDGKSYIWSSIIGLVILLGAYVLLNTINPDLVNFKINTVCLRADNPGCKSNSSGTPQQ